MPIKRVRFSWDVPIEALMALCSTGNADLSIDVIGDNKVKALPRLAGRNGTKLLESPQKVSGRQILIKFLSEHRERGFTTKELHPLYEAAGHSKAGVAMQLHYLMKLGLVKRTAPSTYRITAKGATHAG